MDLRPIGMLLLITAGAANGQQLLFESTDTLALTIEAPMRELIVKRREKPEFDAQVTYQSETGQLRSLPARIESRGNSRLDTCDFPPIRIEFAPADVGGTPFEGQRRLKMVTPCNQSSKARSWLHQEYGIYEAFGAVSEHSFRVRRLQVTFRDDESARWERELPAFFIEHAGRMAKRLNMRSVRPPEIETAQFDGESLTLNLLFQYFIGNTDFSVKRGPAGEGCCHNGRVIATKGRQDGFIVVPYDFDQAGVINTDYALPDKRLGIRSVSSRLYRGFCWQNDMLPDAIERFNERREAITGAMLPDELPGSRKRRVQRFIDRFYETVNDPQELERRLVAKCRGAAAFEIRITRTER